MNQPDRSFRPTTGISDTQPANQGDGLPPVDFLYLLSVLRLHARTILVMTLTAAVVMFVYLLYASPIFSANARIVLDTRKERVTPAEEIVSNLDVSSSVIAGEVVTMHSNLLLGEVVDALDLVNHPAYDPRVPRPEPIFDRLKRFARQGEAPHIVAQHLSQDALRSSVIDTLRQNLEVSQIGVSYAINIAYRDTDPEMAARIANAVSERYIDSQLNAKLSASTRANAWLAARLDELSVQVEESDAAVVDFRAAMNQSAQGSEESINQLLAELNTRLVASSTERADAEVRLGQIETLLTTGGITAVADVVTSPLLETLMRQRADLAARQAELASTLGRKHPEMIRISAQLDDIDRSIKAELERRLEEMRSEAVVTRNRQSALQTQIDRVSERADALSRASVRLGQLERTANATRLVYENFLSRYKETSAQADFQTPQARVIGRAEVPIVPSEPRKTLMMIAAIVLGFSSAVTFVFLRNLIRSPVSTVDELRAVTGTTNLAVLPNVPHMGKSFAWLHQEISDNPRTTFLERVKSIQTALFETSASQEPKVVMITSSVPNEGKTVLSCALAKVSRRGKLPCLLVDADLRRPDIRSAIGLPQDGPCLVEYLKGRGNLKDLVQHSESFGVDVISPARRHSDAAELLASPQFEKMLSRLSQRYGRIIVNAPPVLYLSDAVLLANLADYRILTVKCGRTPAKVLRSSLLRLEAAGVGINGTVLTMVRRADSAAHETGMYTYGY